MYAGKVTWQQPQPLGLHSTLPVLSVPDLDGDEVGDVALVMSDNTKVNVAGTVTSYNVCEKCEGLHLNVSSLVQTVQMVFLSGKTGLQFGSAVVLNSTESANHLLHRSPAGSHYVFLQKGQHPKQSARNGNV